MTTWTENGHTPSTYSTDTVTSAHLDGTVDVHDASAISYLGSTNLASTNVEAALDELDAEKVSKAGDTITAAAATVIPLTVKGAATQSSDLQQWQDSAGAVLIRVDASGKLLAGAAGSLAAAVLRPKSTNSTPLSIYNPNPSAAAFEVRGAASQTANLVEVQDSSGNIGTRIGPGGTGIFTGTLGLTSPAAAVQPLIVRGAASQTANLAEFQNSAGTVLAQINNAGAIYAGSTGAIAGSSGGNVSVGFSPNNGTGQVVLAVRGAASQTANLAEFQNSAGTVLAAVPPTGGFLTERVRYQGTLGTNFTPGASNAAIRVEIDGTAYKIPAYNFS